MRTKRLPIVLLMLPTLLFCHAARAGACPLCDSDRARQVRAGLFDSRFAYNVGVTALPFALFAGIVALTYYGLPLPRLRAVKRSLK